MYRGHRRQHQSSGRPKSNSSPMKAEWRRSEQFSKPENREMKQIKQDLFLKNRKQETICESGEKSLKCKAYHMACLVCTRY